MPRTALALTLVALAGATASPARAGPAHVLASRAITPVAADAGYAVAPDLDAGSRRALTEGLREAGLRVTEPDQPHDYLVTVRAQAGAICSRSCSALTSHDEGPLADYYRHVAVVTAQADAGPRAKAGQPAAWYTLLQSDGFSARTGDFLPGLLRYGAKAYGRTTTPQAAPHLSPLLTSLPDVAVSPG